MSLGGGKHQASNDAVNAAVTKVYHDMHFLSQNQCHLSNYNLDFWGPSV